MFRSRKKLLFAPFTLILLVIAIVLVTKTLNQPATGTVLKPARSNPSQAEPELKTLKAQHFTTLYPARYSAKPSDQSASLEAWTLIAHQTANGDQSSKITLIVTSLPAGGVKDDSAYKLFSARSDLYKLSSVNYKGESAIVASRQNGGYQKTVLWPHGNLLLTATLTAGQSTDKVNRELNTVLSKLDWD